MTNQPHRITLPVLMLLTSHRKDCFDLCLWCLEAFTDLNRFKRIYVLDNDVTEEHRESIRAFSQRHDHVAVVRCSPRGLVPAVMQAQNAILAERARDGVIKVDEDVFVTPPIGWSTCWGRTTSMRKQTKCFWPGASLR